MNDPYIRTKSIWREELENFRASLPVLIKLYTMVFVIAGAYELIVRIAW